MLIKGTIFFSSIQIVFLEKITVLVVIHCKNTFLHGILFEEKSHLVLTIFLNKEWKSLKTKSNHFTCFT